MATFAIGADPSRHLDIAKQLTLKLTRTPLDYTNLTKDPPEVEDLYLVVHYKLSAQR